MQSFESVDVRIFVHECVANKIIESSKLSTCNEIEMKEKVLLQIRNNISMNGVGVFDKVLGIFYSANQQCAELAEHMKSTY